MKRLYNININMIEFIIHKYCNKVIKFIKHNTYRKILINIQIKNNHFHNNKLLVYLDN